MRKHPWKICVDQPFKNCNYIYPIQQKRIQSIIEHLSKDNNVKRIIVFGSSVSDRCHVGSDIDLYIELCEEKPVIKKAFDFPFDLWTNFSVDERLYREIQREGVIVYG